MSTDGGGEMPGITQPLSDERALLTFTSVDGSAEIAELLGAIQQLSLARSLTEIQTIVRGAARRLTGADGATVVLRREDECLYAEEDASSPLWKGQSFPIDADIAGWTMLNHEPAVIADVYADPRVAHDVYRPTFVRSLAMVPIRRLDPLGAIGNYWAESHVPTDHEVQLLQALADSTAVAMENVRAYAELATANAEALRRLALAAEYRDDSTYRHTERVAHLAAHIARKLGLDERFIALLRKAAPLHDVGKLAISDDVLLKQDVLTSGEIMQMRAHAVCGAEILAGSGTDVLALAEEIALSHHEWWDGSGYPNRLVHDEIPLSGRIVAVADVFDALIHARPYKQPWTLDEALQEIQYLSGKQFDPMVVSAFFKLDEADLALDDAESNPLIAEIQGSEDVESLAGSPAA